MRLGIEHGVGSCHIQDTFPAHPCPTLNTTVSLYVSSKLVLITAGFIFVLESGTSIATAS